MKRTLFSIRLFLVVLIGIFAIVGCEKKKKDDSSSAAIAILASGSSSTLAPATGTGAASTYTIGGTITGLTASGLVLQNNSGNDLTVSSGATTFTFTTAIASGGAYSVTVKTQPTGLICTVNSGSGTVSANVTNVSITCSTTTTFTIGGTITGLTASGLVLQNNAGNDLIVSSGAATFTFTTAIASGGVYAVTIKTQPTGLTCTVNSGSGTASANVTNIALACTFPPITRNWGTFTDKGDGTVKLVVTAGTWGGQSYTAQTLTWMKCSHGQTWKSSTNDCTGTGVANAYGATTVQYCSVGNESCNDGTSKLLNGTGTSSAYTACNSLNAGAGTYGKTNWRVPIKNELKLLVNCNTATEMPVDTGLCSVATSPTINNLFPNTVANSYWSSSTYAILTANAWGVSFSIGLVADKSKTDNNYVRCVSGP